MNNNLDLFNKIIFGDLRPWINRGIHEDKYKQLTSEIKKESLTYIPNYKVDFKKPFNAKTKYFHTLIVNESIRYRNSICQLVSEAEKESLKVFWVNTTLTKKIIPKIKDLLKVYQLQGFNTEPIIIESKADTYILDCLKVELVYMYLEVQKGFSNLVKEEILELEDLYSSILEEDIPNPSYIKQEALSIPNLVIENKPIFKEQKEIEIVEKTEFTPLKGDIQRKNSNKSKFIFDDLKDSKLFLQFEVLLHDYGFINNEYNYVECHGRKTELAAIYKVLINKNYFRPNGVRSSKYLPYHYRQFLEHRYDINISFQFKTIKQEQIEAVTSKYHWLHSLPVCR